jgi:CRISPR/Cas system CSM-associated protein Csm3 (group 7 of RAMP superfamily)
MSKRADVSLTLLSDTIIGSGYSIPGGEDIAVKTDSEGYPYLAGETFKGLLVSSLEDWLEWCCPETASKRLAEFMGDRGGESWHGNQSPKQVFVTPLLLSDEDRKKEADQCFGTRTFTKIEQGIATKGSLRVASCVRSGLTFVGSICCNSDDKDDLELLESSLQCIKYIGTSRTRGFGRVCVTVGEWEAVERHTPSTISGTGTVLRYSVTLKQPLRITNRNESHDTFLASQRYIPGSTVRGAVLNALAQADETWFEENKKVLLKQVRFCNVLPDGGRDGSAVIPTPKGFYEDKLGKDFYHLLTENDVHPNTKRAGLGSFSVLDTANGKIDSWSAKTGENTRINLKQQHDPNSDGGGMFQTNWMEAGQTASGLVILPENASSELKQKLGDVLNGEIRFGAGVHSGCGLCEVKNQRWTETLPELDSYSYQTGDSVPTVLYLCLLSPTMLINEFGDPCGMTKELFSELLGVEVTDLMCSTSVIERQGFNRTIGVRLPINMMYDSGSTFRLTCKTAPSLEVMRTLERNGLGIRREEGFGRMVFLKELNRIKEKVVAPPKAAKPMTEAKRRQWKRSCWINEHDIPEGLSSSQLGDLQRECEGLKNRPNLAVEKLEWWFEDKIEKNDNNRPKFERTKELFLDVVQLKCKDVPATSIEEGLQLLIDLIKANRKGDD